jgi:hypothetical protein
VARPVRVHSIGTARQFRLDDPDPSRPGTSTLAGGGPCMMSGPSDRAVPSSTECRVYARSASGKVSLIAVR